MVIANGNVCTYYPAGESGCTNNPSTGVFALPETSGDGMNLLISSGCASAIVHSPPQTNECTGTGEWDMLVKNVQVWQLSLANKVVK